MTVKRYYLLIYVLLCITSAVYENIFYWYGQPPSEPLLRIVSWSYIFLLLMWVYTDSKEQSNKIFRPFDYGYLIFLFWLPYLPYYFWRTRGVLGLVWLFGLLSFSALGYIAYWAISFTFAR